MNQDQLINEIAKRLKITKKMATTYLETFLDIIKEGLQTSGSIRLPNILKLEIINSKPRISKNPKTGDKVFVPEKQKIRCKISKNLKKLI